MGVHCNISQVNIGGLHINIIIQKNLKNSAKYSTLKKKLLKKGVKISRKTLKFWLFSTVWSLKVAFLIRLLGNKIRNVIKA